MKLSDLIPCEFDTEIEKVTDDSRTKGSNILFVCVKGLTVDGHNFAAKAIENGAVALITERKLPDVTVPQVVVKDSQKEMNLILNRFYGNPMDAMKIIGVTGTDGKTTTAEMIYQILNRLNKKTGYIGTNGIRSEGFSMDCEYTTPLQEDFFKALNGFKKDNCEFVSMEASGERLGTGKMEGVRFDASIFTNLSRDALDIFKTMDNYALAKARLMAYTGPNGICVINKDDKYADVFIKAANEKVVTYAVNDKPADVYASDIEIGYRNLSFKLNGILGERKIHCNLSGIFNVYNICGVLIALSHFGFSTDELIEAVNLLEPIDARQETIDFGQPFKVIVDYAHTANAVKNLTEYIKSTLTDGFLRVVVGAGGSRDIHRRTDMAEYCTAIADYNYFTIEDARYDEPQMLLETMVSTLKSGVSNYELIEDRDEAIKKALSDARPGDAVLILGKGSEAYMLTKGVLVPRLNDFDSAKKVLRELGYNS